MSDATLTRGRRVLLGALGLGAVLGATAAAAVVYVNAGRLDVADRKSSVFKTVVTVQRNAPLTVIAKEGRWYKVEVGGKQGYVAETAVSQTPVPRNQRASLAKVNGAAVPELETAAAVKGIGEATRQYASAGGLRTDGLEEMIRRRDAITPAEFERFTAATRAGAPSADASPATGAHRSAVASTK